MRNPPTFKVGDKVAHPKKPEWGTGVVVQAQTVTHDGVQAQRLRVDFANKRNTTLNTAIAPLVSGDAVNPNNRTPFQSPKGLGTDMSMSTDASKLGAGWLDQLEGRSGGKRELWDLPAACNDPFASDEQQLDATLDTFKYSTDPGPLFQWAVVQTGLDDPLTKHTRVELEQAFPRFARDRDNRLFELVRQMKRNGETDLLRRKAQNCPHRAGRQLLEKALRA
ncbi:MAG: DUF3553 domain-containing protein [Phycisphaeraceae bacterium]